MRAALADAAWGFGGEKGQRTALPSLPLPASVGRSWPAVPGVYSLLAFKGTSAIYAFLQAALIWTNPLQPVCAPAR